MHFATLPDDIETTIQWVRWTIVAVFFIMTILAWRAAGKDWFQEEGPVDEINASQPQEEANIEESRS